MPTVIPFTELDHFFPGHTLETQLRPQRYLVEGDEEIFAYVVHGMGQDGRALTVTASGHVWHQHTDGSPVSLGGPILQIFMENKGDRNAAGAAGLTVTGLFDMRGEEAKWLNPERAVPLLNSNRSAAQAMQQSVYQIMTLAGLSHVPSQKPLLLECLTATPASAAEYRLETQRELEVSARLIDSYADMIFPISALATLNGAAQKVLIARVKDTVDDVLHPERHLVSRQGEMAPGGGAQLYTLEAFRRK